MEQTNIQRAVIFGLQWPETAISSIQLLVQVFPFIEYQGKWDTWVALFHQAISVCPAAEQTLRCHLLNRRGQLLRLTRHLETAVADHETALALSRQTHNLASVAETLFNLGKAYRQLRRYAQAAACGEEGLQVLYTLPQATMPRLTAGLLHTLGLIAWEMGQLDIAETRLVQAVNCWRSLAAPTELARVLNSLAIVRQAQGDTGAALTLY